MTTKSPKRRSQAWCGKQDRDGFVHRSWTKKPGYPHDSFDGSPVIGICNTWSEMTPCNSHFRELADFVSMDVEESIRGNPIDSVVLLMGCDKTTPALLMGAASCGLPTIGLSGGAMLNGKFRGKDIGSGTGVWMMSEMVRAGQMSQSEFTEAEACMNRSTGTCMTMGTASSMASMVEAMGMSLPENAAIPAADSCRNRLAQLTGRRIVQMVEENLTMDQILTRQAFEYGIQDVPARRLHIDGSDEVLQRRRAQWVKPDMPARGYAKLYVEHVQQAHLGAELDFLVGRSGAAVPRESH